MFSSTRLHMFVCIALGITVSAAPASAPGSKVARSPDVYDGSGGIAAVLLGLDGEERGGNSDEDVYILKRQLADLDIGSRLGSNMGIAHAPTLGEGALGLSSDVEARSPDIYDASGGVAGLLLGLEGEERGGNDDEDVYILKRQLADLDIGSRLSNNMGLAHATTLGEGALGLSNRVEARSPDIYDASGGVAGLLLGLEGEERGENSDEDVYILKRQLDNLDLDIGSRLGSNMGLTHAAGLGEGALGLSSGVEARSPDIYDASGGVAGLLLGLEGEERGGNSDEDVYILKRQLADLDIGSRLGTNMGLTHAAGLGEGALGLSSDVEARSPDIYDASGGVAGLLLGLEGEERGADSDEDVYIL